MIRHLYILLLFSYFITTAQPSGSENLIFITIDGMRWQEIFNGADEYLLNNDKFTHHQSEMKNRFWNESSFERRKQLLPFFWTTLVADGQIYGNRELGNRVNVSNSKWFSYPGYSEILCGFADDERITSNRKFNNPNVTFLEFLNHQNEFKNKVAAFGSWDVFPVYH